MMLDCAGKSLDLSFPALWAYSTSPPIPSRTGVSFFAPERAVEHALQMVEAGAAIVDVGGESTRPGAEPVPEDVEMRRVIPVIEALHGVLSVPVSIDTRKPAVMRRRCGGRRPDQRCQRPAGAGCAWQPLPHSGCRSASCTCRVRRRPCRRAANIADVVGEVAGFLVESRARQARRPGWRGSVSCSTRVSVLARRHEHNLLLLRQLDPWSARGYRCWSGCRANH